MYSESLNANYSPKEAKCVTIVVVFFKMFKIIITSKFNEKMRNYLFLNSQQINTNKKITKYLK